MLCYCMLIAETESQDTWGYWKQTINTTLHTTQNTAGLNQQLTKANFCYRNQCQCHRHQCGSHASSCQDGEANIQHQLKSIGIATSYVTTAVRYPAVTTTPHSYICHGPRPAGDHDSWISTCVGPAGEIE